MFLDCPAHLDERRTVRCGLPAEVKCRFTVRSTDGPLDSVMIRCAAGHWFNGPIEALTRESKGNREPGIAAVVSSASYDTVQSTHDGRANGGGFAIRDYPAGPQREVSRPNTAPAYYLSRPASLWITAMRPRHSRTGSNHPMEAVTVAGNEPHPGAAARQPATGTAARVPLTLA